MLAILALVPHEEVTHLAVADGAWTDSATWEGGRVPKNGACVLIPHGLTVTFDQHKAYRYAWIRIDGSLIWATNKSTYMLVHDMVTTRGGVRKIGDIGSPLDAAYTAEIVISGRDYSEFTVTPTNLVLDRDANLWSRGTFNQGTNIMVGARKTTWLKANAPVPQGATSLTFPRCRSAFRLVMS